MMYHIMNNHYELLVTQRYADVHDADDGSRRARAAAAAADAPSGR